LFTAGVTQFSDTWNIILQLFIYGTLIELCLGPFQAILLTPEFIAGQWEGVPLQRLAHSGSQVD